MKEEGPLLPKTDMPIHMVLPYDDRSHEKNMLAGGGLIQRLCSEASADEKVPMER